MSSTSFGQGIQSGTDYAWQEFFDALRQAVASTVPLQARLATFALAVYNLREDNFPDTDTWMRFESFLEATTGLPKKATAAKILAATSKMTEEEAGKLLQEAVHIFSNLSEESEM